MSVSAFPYGTAAASKIPPLVSALANGDSNSISEALALDCDCGVRFNTDGDEYETNFTGSYNVNVGQWLDQGTSDQVWVLHTRTAGVSNFDGKANATRFQISSSQTFNLNRSTVGTDTITGTFSFYDAASGGNLLQTTSSATYTATLTFDSCPLCCFTPDTPILMASGLQMPIGKIQEGDMIAVYNPDTNDIEEQAVTEVIARINRPMYRLHFANGAVVEASAEHPFHVKGKGPASLDNFDTEYKDLGKPDTLKLGDCVTGVDLRNHPLVKVEPLEYPDTVFTLRNSLFFAGGLLVY